MLKKSVTAIIRKIANHEPLEDREKMEYVLYSITNHGGKMEGIPSISTSCLCNARCQARRENPDLICYHCYAAAYTDYRKSLAEKLYMNTQFYTFYELTKECIPTIASRFFRFEAFGDLNNALQVNNYFMIARYNRHTAFALWTKNPDIVEAAITAGTKKPSNMTIIYSIEKINHEFTIEDFRTIKKQYPFIDRVFLVYTKEYIDMNNVCINCGSRACIADCGCKCYDKSNRTRIVREKQK